MRAFGLFALGSIFVAATAAAVDVPRGACISGDGVQGRIGTSLRTYTTRGLVEIEGWLTALSAISTGGPIPDSGIAVSLCSGTRIGRVMPSGYFVRNEYADAAIIVPDTEIQFPYSPNAAGYVVANEDIGKEVTLLLDGGQTRTGIIASRDFSQNQPGLEKMSYQILIRPLPGKVFARKGDAGALVMIGNQTVGIVRGIDYQNGRTTVTPYLSAAGELRKAAGIELFQFTGPRF